MDEQKIFESMITDGRPKQDSSGRVIIGSVIISISLIIAAKILSG